MAIELIFEQDEQGEGLDDSTYMRHSCVPYVPPPKKDEEEEKKQEPLPYKDNNNQQRRESLGDLEMGSFRSEHSSALDHPDTICFICQRSASNHRRRANSFESSRGDNDEKLIKAAQGEP